MAQIAYPVTELAQPLKIEDSVIIYAELQLGMQRNTRFGQHKERVRLGLQTSPENFFYDETAFSGAPYVNLNALEFTALAGTAEALAYDTAPGIELWSIVGGEVDGLGALVPGSETCKSALKVNFDLIEQVEVREGDTFTVCDTNGDPVDTTVMQVHLSLKSSNKPDFTFYQWHPQAKYRFNRQCNVCSDALAPENTVAYMGDNNYVLSEALMTDVIGKL
jgi:hypothetical protein